MSWLLLEITFITSLVSTGWQNPFEKTPVSMLMDGLFVNQANGNYVMDKCAWETCASWPRVNG